MLKKLSEIYAENSKNKTLDENKYRGKEILKDFSCKNKR